MLHVPPLVPHTSLIPPLSFSLIPALSAFSLPFHLTLHTTHCRVFGGDRIKNLMVAFRVEDLPMESQMLTDALDTAQKRVESYFYDIRK